MISALNRLANGTVELTITIPASRVNQAYAKTLTDLTKTVQISGFRQGKAPKKLVENKLGQKEILKETVKSLIPEVYLEAIKEHQLKPILNPHVEILANELNKDWQIKALTCEMPTVKLGQYEEEIKKAKATSAIWVPGKDPQPKKDKLTEEEKLSQVFKALLQTSQVQIPTLLVQEEVNRMLSRLVDQTGRLGLTIDQYLASLNKSLDQLKAEYQQQAEETLKLELILITLAEIQKIKVSDEEIDKLIAAAPDKETQNKLAAPEQRNYLRQLLKKRQIIDNLSSLL